MVETPRKERRKHTRVYAPKELLVAWRAGAQQGVSRLGTVGLGGLFLKTKEPLSEGCAVDLMVRVSSGNDVRAKAIVRNVMPGKGMGVEFIKMSGEDRTRLNKFLSAQLESGRISFETLRMEPRAVPQDLSEAEGTSAARHPGETELSSESPAAGSDRAQPDITEVELRRCLNLADTGTYYELLEISSGATREQVKQAFYALARKFHPDRHMSRPDWKEPLQQIMGAATDAYQTLVDDDERFVYNKRLANATRTESEESIDDCIKIAEGCLRDENLAGYVFWMRKCVLHAPGVAQYRVSLAVGLMQSKGLRYEAIEQFRKAIQLDAFHVNAYLQFGALYEQMELPWRARPLYVKVLEIDPHHTTAMERLARLDIEEAEKKKISPKDARLLSKK